MIERMIDQARVALEGGQRDPEGLQAFLRDFCQHPFWIRARVTDHVGGKDLVSFSFSRLEGMALPVLMLYCQEEDGLRRAEGRGAVLQTFQGLDILSLAGKSPFHATLIDGDDRLTLDHGQLLAMGRQQGLEGPAMQPGQSQDPDRLQQALPQAFTSAIHQYCRMTPDIRQCRIGIVESSKANLPSLDCLVLLEGDQLDRHRGKIAELAGQHLPPDQPMLLLEPESDSGRALQYAALLKTFAPFYSRNQEQDWWSRLKRRLKPPRVPWIKAEFGKD